MKPGLPFRIVLAKDSKRKIQAAVAYAANLASRFPTDSFQATKLLLAIPCDGASEQQAAPFIDRASVLHGTNVVPAPNNRAACTYQRGNANNTVYSVEELVGVQLFDRPPIWNPDWSHPRLLANTKVLTPISTSARAAHLMDFQTDAEFSNSSQHLVDPGTSSAQQGCVSVWAARLSDLRHDITIPPRTPHNHPITTNTTTPVPRQQQQQHSNNSDKLNSVDTAATATHQQQQQSTAGQQSSDD
ncbi:hypothetical protein CF336_g9035 [Tilletia laevis]|nr:hypothetical protein CF336_g9035 [Tilletia laevis]